ncbi:hypothetical protein LIER_08073 [Lithospermum erythrorhizon]|uniref:Pentatricopeptide repeat-containing protein n=1 Tax=Lithospermum erythrorhizon TaxID=34254 RepID=A0AAV3PDC1_LITER
MPQPNSFIFNTLISAYSRSSQPHKAIHYFNLMLTNMLGFGTFSLVADHHTFPYVIIACANLGLVVEGGKIHCWVLKNGLGSFDCHVQTALLRLYVSCKALGDARKVFDEIAEKDTVHCNVLISGYLKCDMGLDGLEVFRNMLVMGIEPDEFCVTTGLAACSKLGALEQGKWIHEYIRKRNMLLKDVFVGTALVDMYAKCGCIDMALEVFESKPRSNAVSWAAIIGGLGTHGDAKRAIGCLRRMYVEDNIRPDGIVLLGVLTACAHAGLHKEGQFLLDKMVELYGVRPEHIGEFLVLK